MRRRYFCPRVYLQCAFTDFVYEPNPSLPLDVLDDEWDTDEVRRAPI
jgi:hypothetical protein